MAPSLSRRSFLTRSAVIGCSLAASPLVTPVSFAAPPGDNRLVVIILRGAMDGLDVLRPVGDPAYAALGRPTAVGGDSGAHDLGGMFALHPALGDLMPMWRRGDLGAVHAVSTPYRDKRSHFTGQDLLEAGLASLGGSRDGWLNRALAHWPGATAETAYSVDSDAMSILEGAAPVTRWSPFSDLALSPQAVRLAQRVMAEDPAFETSFAAALRNADSDGDGVAIEGGAREMNMRMKEDIEMRRGADRETVLASYVAARLSEEARIAAFSINGWDSHIDQDRILGGALERLARTLLVLEAELAPAVWQRTAIVAMTEFGRTAAMNGSRGTDHGTGGAMLMAGGAVRGGQVAGDWPGLAEADLYDRRDLMPTRDVRAHAAWLLSGLFGLDRRALERDVFPGLDMGAAPGLLL